MIIRILTIEKFLGHFIELAGLVLSHKIFYFHILSYSKRRYETTISVFSVSFGEYAEYNYAKGFRVMLLGHQWQWIKKHDILLDK